MTAYDSIERGAADECEPLRGRRPRTFTLTHLLVACGAVCVCAIGATMVVNTHLANFGEDLALANFDLGSAVDDDSAFDGDSAFDDELALADFDDNSVDDNPEGAQLGQTGNETTWRSCRRKNSDDFSKKIDKCKNLVRSKYRRCIAWNSMVYTNGAKKCDTTFKNKSPSYVKTNIPKWGGGWPMARGFRHSGSPRARNPKACEEKCNQNGDCIGFSDYRGVCYFARTRGDWYAKPKPN